VFLDEPEEYDEVAATHVELLAVPKNVMTGVSAKFVEMMKKGAEKEREFYAEQVKKKLGLMQIMGNHHTTAGNMRMHAIGVGSKAALLLHESLGDASIGSIMHRLNDGSPAAGGDQDADGREDQQGDGRMDGA
jgi:hypothetical protein